MCRFEDNIKLAMKLAKKYSRITRHEYDDLFQIASLALWQASEMYDEEGEVPFGAFAAQRIVFAILNYMKVNNLIKVPRTDVDNAVSINKKKLQDESPEVIAEKLGITVNSAKNALMHLKLDVKSLEYKYKHKNGETRTLGDYVPLHINFIEELEIKHLKKELKPRECEVVELMLSGYSQREVADMYNMTAANIFRILQIVRRKLQPLKEAYTS